MEAKLKNLELGTELSSVPTNTELLHKAWHLLCLLLSIGRPARSTELESRCTLFRALPEFVEFLCSIPNSPLLLTNDHFVTISSVAIGAFRQFVLNSSAVAPFVPRIGLGVLAPKRVWEDVARTYYRKRRRVRSDLGCLPVVKTRDVWQNVDAEGEDNYVLTLRNGIQNACANVHFHIDMSRSMITQPCSTSVMAFSSEKLDEEMVTTSSHINFNAGLLSCGLKNAEHESQRETDMFVNRKEIGCVYTPEYQYSFHNYERFLHMPSAITVEGIKDCMPHPEPSLLTSTTENSVVWREVKIDEVYSISRIDSNPTLRPKVDDQMVISLVEAENVNSACKAIVKSGEDERVMEGREEQQLSNSGSHKGDDENMPINTTNMDMLHEDDFKSNIMLTCNDMLPSMDREKTTAYVDSQAILSANLPSLDQMQLAKSPAKLKLVQKDAVNTRLQGICETNSKAISANTEQQQCKRNKLPISMKHKLMQNYDQKTRTKEKRGNSKEKRGKPVSINLKKQREPKILPNFESFIVEEEEGSGGYGTVYRAQRKNDGAMFAIKCPHVNANRRHVHNELKMLERFGGKNFVIKYEGSFKSGNSDCLVLEHVEHDRPDVLKREIDVFHLQWYGYCLFRALAGLHKQGVVHRDVKPGNFLFSRKVNKGYLIDFNLAMDLHQKYGITEKSTMGYDVSFDHVPLPQVKSLPPAKSRNILATKALEAVNQEAGIGSKPLLLSKNLKNKTNQTKENSDLSSRNVMKSQGADGSGITSAKDATSTRIPSAERLRQPIPCQGRKELISLAQEAMQGPTNEVVNVPASKRKRIAAPPGRLDRKLVYLTPMPLNSTEIAVAGLVKNKGEGKLKREGPCVGTKGFRAPEVLFKSPYQGPKVDTWSAGVTLLYLITGRTPFIGDPDQNIKEIAKLRGSEDLWEVAKLHNRESSLPPELFDVQSLPSIKLQDWCKLNTRRPDFLEVIPRSFFDLVDNCLAVNPRMRLSAEEALRHEFFAPCHERLRKQRLLRQGMNLVDSGTAHLLHRQSKACEGLS